MTGFSTTIIGDKREWKATEARANLLPRGYRVVHGEMKSYRWRFTAGDGMDVVAILRLALDLFEDAAAAGKGVLEVIGRDVAAFCDARLRGTATYLDQWRAALDHDVAAGLAE